MKRRSIEAMSLSAPQNRQQRIIKSAKSLREQIEKGEFRVYAYDEWEDNLAEAIRLAIKDKK